MPLPDLIGGMVETAKGAIYVASPQQSLRIKQAARCYPHQRGPNHNGSYEDHAMAKSQLPTPDELRQLLRYEPETGKLFWRTRTPYMFTDGNQTAAHSCGRWNSRWAGKEVGTTNSHGYKTVVILHGRTSAHRIAWAMCNGRWPSQQLDHINGVRDDNRIINLREVSNMENARNTKRHKNNNSGRTGVFYVESRGIWNAYINVNWRKRSLGNFKTFEQACAAREQAEIEMGFHENHGRQDQMGS